MIPSLCPWRLSQSVSNIRLDVTVVGTVLPVAEVGVAEGVPEERDHALLGEDFPLTDGAHGFSRSPLTLYCSATGRGS